MRHVAEAAQPFLRLLTSLSDEEWTAKDAAVAKERAEIERGDRRRRLEENGFPRRALDVAEQADESVPGIVRIARWNRDEESTLILSGGTGCGKTVAATWWAFRQPTAPLFLSAPALAAASQFDHDLRNKWLNAGALVLDDLGEEIVDAKGAMLARLDELVNSFYEGKRALVVTTNCTLEQFSARYGARVRDRIRECGSFASLGNASLRGKR